MRNYCNYSCTGACASKLKLFTHIMNTLYVVFSIPPHTTPNERGWWSCYYGRRNYIVSNFISTIDYISNYICIYTCGYRVFFFLLVAFNVGSDKRAEGRELRNIHIVLYIPRSGVLQCIINIYAEHVKMYLFHLTH